MTDRISPEEVVLVEPSARRDRRAERHQATKREILDAAWSVAREHGMGGWSFRDVAGIVGMRAPSLYEYFRNKNAVYDAMFADGYRQFLARIDQAPTGGELTEIARNAAHLFFDFCVEDPARYQLLFLRTIPGFVPSAESFALARESLERLEAVLSSIGATTPQALDLWTALMTGLASQQISNDPGGQRWQRLIDDAVSMYLGAITATLGT